MVQRLLAVLTLLTSLGFATPALLAYNTDQHDHDDNQGWETRQGYEYHTYSDHDQRPPGWSQGKKTGWENCGMPPGQAKKYGCRTYTYEGRPYYYYEGEDGRMYVRRPVADHDHEHDNH